MKTAYRSKFEATVHQQVPTAQYEPCKLPFVQPAKTRTYTPDLVLPNGIVLECKGVLTTADRAKMLWVREAHPHLDIRFVFQRASNKIAPKSKTTYADWCNANGFLWCERTIPPEWLA